LTHNSKFDIVVRERKDTMSKAHLTAISRKNMSVPTKYLLKKGLLGKKVLDFGCGKGEDVRQLRAAGFEADGYDPYYAPEVKLGRDYDTVICNYVFNVIAPEERHHAWNNLYTHALGLSGRMAEIYVTVRRDLKKDYVKTSRGTEQWMVRLPYEVVHETSTYCIYRVSKRCVYKVV
jgi:DNA phosphorothioation-associated putative methyltransferase